MLEIKGNFSPKVGDVELYTVKEPDRFSILSFVMPTEISPYDQDIKWSLSIKENGHWRVAAWDEALAAAAAVLKSASATETGILAHPASSNEEGYMLSALANAMGVRNIDHRIKQLDFADAAVAEVFGTAVADIERAESIILVGCNIRHEMPLLHQRIHQAVKRGTKVHVINPVDFDFTFDVASKTIVPPSGLAGALSELSATLVAGSVLILGEIAENHADASHLRASAKALQQAGKASVCRLPQGANAIGLAQHGVLPGEGGRHAGAMLNGDLKSMLLFGIEPQFDFSDTTRAVKALVGAKVIACSAYLTESLKELADVILPIGLLPEIQATLTNVDGRNQHAEAAGKLPGSAQSGWRVLRALYDAASLPAMAFTDIDGLRSGLTKQTVASGAGLSPKHALSDGFERISTSPIYRGDAVTRRADSLQAHPLNTGPHLVMHPAAAAKAGLQEGQIAKVGDGTGSATLPVVLSRMIPESCVWIETNHPATAPLSQTASLAIVRAAP